MKVKFLQDYKKAVKGDVGEVSDELGEGLIAKGIAIKDEQKVVAEIDTKALSIAIADGFKDFQKNRSPEVIEKKVIKTFGQHLLDVANGNVKYGVDGGLITKDINITTPADGQYATTILTYTQDIDILRPSSLASLVGRITYTGTDNELHWNVLTDVGTAPAITNESTLINPSQPLLTQYLIRMQKLTYLYYASKEALQDTGLLTQLVNEAVSEAFTKYIENKLLHGTYVSDGIDGITGNSGTYVVPEDSGQTADTITDLNINNMFAAAKRPEDSVWVMSRSAWGAVQGLRTSGTTLGFPLFTPPNGYKETPFGMLKGLPIVISDQAAALGNVGDINLCNFKTGYKLVQKGGMTVPQRKSGYGCLGRGLRQSAEIALWNSRQMQDRPF